VWAAIFELLIGCPIKFAFAHELYIT